MLLPFVLRTSGVGVDELTVNGRDVLAHVSRVTVDCRTDEPTKLYLEENATGEIRGDGIVVVSSPVANAPQVINGWLKQLDSTEIEKHVLAHADMGTSFTRSVLDRLIELSSGA